MSDAQSSRLEQLVKADHEDFAEAILNWGSLAAVRVY